MGEFYGRAEYEAAAKYVESQTKQKPTIGIVLGSGLGNFAESVQNADIIAYEGIPNWPRSTVQGHAGQLYVGSLEGQTVMAMRGRTHFYEGYPISQITLPIRVMQLMGVKTLLVTNAAGGINKTYKAGDLMLLADHINMVGMAGNHPLRGPNDQELGERFPDMSMIYDAGLRGIAKEIASDGKITLHEGVYVALSGPSFETPAEIRFLRAIGADAVGMSTAWEAVVARHGGLKVLGVSGISNTVNDQPQAAAASSHEEVLEAGKQMVPRLEAIFRGVLKQMPAAS
jgi:purine-nucleoside phosphorylase